MKSKLILPKFRQQRLCATLYPIFYSRSKE